MLLTLTYVFIALIIGQCINALNNIRKLKIYKEDPYIGPFYEKEKFSFIMWFSVAIVLAILIIAQAILIIAQEVG